MNDLPVQRAKEQGHDVVSDPPASGMAERWTCTKCGRAILRYAGNIYGGAKEFTCKGERVML